MGEHITMIMCVLGVPSDDDLKKLSMLDTALEKVSGAIKRAEYYPQIANSWDVKEKTTKWSKVYPEVDESKWRPELTTLLNRLLAFHPSARASAAEALVLPYFAEWHDPEQEPVCDRPIDWSFDTEKLTMSEVRNAIYEECIAQSSADDISSSLVSKSQRTPSSRLSVVGVPSPAFFTGE